jgi:hypothetical protein
MSDWFWGWFGPYTKAFGKTEGVLPKEGCVWEDAKLNDPAYWNMALTVAADIEEAAKAAAWMRRRHESRCKNRGDATLSPKPSVN